MNTIDVNCFLGHWPFRKIRRGTFADLQAVHAANAIAFGFVSSLDSIFYNDPFEGDEDLHETLKGSSYRQILSVNPELPGWQADISRGVRFFGSCGVRIYPAYHGYDLNSRPVDALCLLLEKMRLPLVLTIRLEDERLGYLIQHRAPAMDDVRRFLDRHKQNAILLTGAYASELLTIQDACASRRNVFFDTSGLKETLFAVEKFLQAFPASQLLYGSQHSLYCLRSSLLLVEKADIDPVVKSRILSSNYLDLFPAK